MKLRNLLDAAGLGTWMIEPGTPLASRIGDGYVSTRAAEIAEGDCVRTDNGESHEVASVDNRGDHVQVTFTCGCPKLIEAPSTMVEVKKA